MNVKCKRCGAENCTPPDRDGGGKCGDVHFEFGYLMAAVEDAIKKGEASKWLTRVYGEIAPMFPHLGDKGPAL